MSATTLKLKITGGRLIGRDWRHFWLKYVTGFRPEVHCARCLEGRYSRVIRLNSPDLAPGALLQLDPPTVYDYGYLCGVALVGGWQANFHAAFVPKPGARFTARAYSGAVFEITGGRRVDIPELPRNYDGRPLAFTTCRNWRFGVAYYGLDAKRR
jgi:hypothetical protein